MALLAVERLERDARDFRDRVLRLLAPEPGRLEFAFRIAAICTLTTLVVEVYGIPDAALTTYIVFFMVRPDRASSVVTDLAFMVLITIVIGLIFLVARTILDDVSLRVLSMALISFGLLFLTSASKLQPVGTTVALIVGYALDLLGSIPAGELATRGYLYAWLFVGIPAVISILYNVLFGPSPRALVQRCLASRMRTAARALVRPSKRNAGKLKVLLRESNAEISSRLKLAGLEQTSRSEELKQLGQAANASIVILSAVDFMLDHREAMPPRRSRALLARAFKKIATNLGRGGCPTNVTLDVSAHEPISDASAAACAEIIRALSTFAGTEAPTGPEAPKEKGGFFVADAFTNSIHVYYALKTTIAAMSCYILYSVLDWPGIHTCFITCYIVSLRTVAETVEKLTLRVIGAMLGAAAGLLTIIFVIPSHDSITDLSVIVLVASLAAGWVAAGSPRISYAGFQFAFAFFLCVIQGAAPSEQLSVARDRVVGVMVGDIVAFIVHAGLWPVSLKSTVESGVATVLQSLADLARATDTMRRRALAAVAQTELGELESNIALIAYEPDSVRPSGTWLDFRHRIAGLLGQVAPAVLIEAEQADTTDISRQLSAIAQHEPLPPYRPSGPVGEIVADRIRELEIVTKEEALAQS